VGCVGQFFLLPEYTIFWGLKAFYAFSFTILQDINFFASVLFAVLDVFSSTEALQEFFFPLKLFGFV